MRGSARLSGPLQQAVDNGLIQPVQTVVTVGGHQDWKTADELMAELEQKREFVDRQRQRMDEREENRRRYGEAAEGLLGDLEEAGFAVETLAQLRRRGVGDRRAVPVLAMWLPEVA